MPATPYEQSQQFVTAGDIRFHYSLDGDPSKPTLALINMASANLTVWENTLDDLLETFQILRFDIRGTGKSGWGDIDDFTFAQYADDLSAIMTTLKIPKAFVLGVAYGARTAAQFAIRHHQQLTGLALFDVALTPPVEQTGQRELGDQAREMLAKAGEPLYPSQKYWRFYEDRDACLSAHTAHPRGPDTPKLLKHLTVRVLVAGGRQDMNLGEAERIAKATPGATFTIMEMTGHGSPMFRPALFAEIVKRFQTEHIQ